MQLLNDQLPLGPRGRLALNSNTIYDGIFDFGGGWKILKIKILQYSTLITEVFPGTRKMEIKEKPLKISCQNPVEHDAI